MSNSILKKTMYAILDLVTLKKGVARKINGMTIRFPASWSRYYEENYEAENYAFFKTVIKPGMHIIDIGAHLGLFSVFSSQLAGPSGKIICFEPTPGTYSVLKKTLQLNHCDNVTPVQAAVSGAEGTTTFYIGKQAGDNSNSLVKNKPDSESSAYQVSLVTIDSIVSKYSMKPSLIKIDAEGAELDVLKGGVQTFRDKPVLVLGLHPAFIKQKGDSLEEIWNVLQSCGYTITMDGKAISKDDFCGRTLIFDVHCS